MDSQTALKILQAAVGRCRAHEMDTPVINAVLDILEARASVKWPFDQFRAALNGKPGEDWESEGRRQILSASLNGIRRAAPASFLSSAASSRVLAPMLLSSAPIEVCRTWRS